MPGELHKVLILIAETGLGCFMDEDWRFVHFPGIKVALV